MKRIKLIGLFIALTIAPATQTMYYSQKQLDLIQKTEEYTREIDALTKQAQEITQQPKSPERYNLVTSLVNTMTIKTKELMSFFYEIMLEQYPSVPSYPSIYAAITAQMKNAFEGGKIKLNQLSLELLRFYMEIYKKATEQKMLAIFPKI